MAGVYYILQGSQGFDNLMHGKLLKRKQKQRNLEDFGKHDGSLYPRQDSR
jgi:H+-transporting ATPase